MRVGVSGMQAVYHLPLPQAPVIQDLFSMSYRRRPGGIPSPGSPGDPHSFHSFSQFQIPYATSFGNGNPS
jgi:hypothetical protein